MGMTDASARLDDAVDLFEAGKTDDALLRLRAEAFGAEDETVLARIAELAQQMAALVGAGKRAEFEAVVSGVERRLQDFPEVLLPETLSAAEAAFHRSDLERAVELLYAAMLASDDLDAGAARDLAAAVGVYADSMKGQLSRGPEWQAFEYVSLAVGRRVVALEGEVGDGQGDAASTADETDSQLAGAVKLAEYGQHDEALRGLRSDAFAAQQNEETDVLTRIALVARQIAERVGGEGAHGFVQLAETAEEAVTAIEDDDSVTALLRGADRAFEGGDLDVTLEIMYQATLETESEDELDEVVAAAGLKLVRVPRRRDVVAFEYVLSAVERRRRELGGRQEPSSAPQAKQRRVSAPGIARPASAPAATIPSTSSQVNGLAIASLVLGIVWLYWLGSILALVFGYVAKAQIDESRGSQTGRGMAVAGIVLGWVGVGFLVLLLVFGVTLLPS